MPQDFFPHLLDSIQQLLLADDLVELRATLQNNSETLLTDEAEEAVTSLLNLASEREDEYAIVRLSTALQTLQRCRQLGVARALFELEELAKAQSAVIRLLMTASPDGIRQLLREHADARSTPAAVDFLKQLIEAEGDGQNLFILRHRLALLERVHMRILLHKVF